ncbi:hypothetical protein LMG28688_04683 [Paraburkholderia caffeinitolerans]|uniref:Uncharacterized protein n=1 Tax=Paraburkholderia caffeinitolerans TaxID=1723730 RepID=A0A6J5GG98_9BURK|nr:hypothetical protein LMG28688_04683 [Paraburkholderia caffeinitolerans]
MSFRIFFFYVFKEKARHFGALFMAADWKN